MPKTVNLDMRILRHIFEEHTKTALTRSAVESILFDKLEFI